MQCGYAISELLATDREEHEKKSLCKKNVSDLFAKKRKIYRIANGERNETSVMTDHEDRL
jgi:hypothetical protein